jgi:D-inositol-3-phosphate glycosyltransferase
MVSEHASPLAVLGGVDAGGQNVHVASLAYQFGRLGHEVVVYTRRDSSELPDRVPMSAGVVVEHVSAGPPEPVPKDELLPYMPEFGASLSRAFECWRPDVVHSHFWMSGMAALAAAQPLGLPLAHTFHALGVVKRRYQGVKDTSPSERLPREEALVREADCILATCSDEAFELVRLGAELHRLKIVPCGVDLSLFRPDGPSEPRTDGLARIVVVARLVERKGIGNAIAALAEVPGAELVIAGGPVRERLGEDLEARRLLTVAREAGVTDRVELRGCLGREEVPCLLRSADVAVCLPWYEPFGIAPLEAMACGVPVLASSVGGLVDTVVDGVTGLLVPPRQVEPIAAALRRLLGDELMRKRLGAAGIERARMRYGWQRVAAATLGVYAKLIRRESRPREETAWR